MSLLKRGRKRSGIKKIQRLISSVFLQNCSERFKAIKILLYVLFFFSKYLLSYWLLLVQITPLEIAFAPFFPSLRCGDIMQVYLLLKSSEFVAHDLTMPFKDCEDFSEAASEGASSEASASAVDYALVVRRWQEINPGHEFRCFVKGGRLVGVTQRDCSKFYEHIAQDRDREGKGRKIFGCFFPFLCVNIRSSLLLPRVK